MFIHINPKTELTLLKKNECKVLILHSKNYFIKYILNKSLGVYFNKNCRVMVLKGSVGGLNRLSVGICKNILNTLNFELTNFVVKKIKFLGKSYKIKKCINYFAFEFNKAHIEVVVWSGYFLKKLKKSTILVKGINQRMVSKVARDVVNIKYINPFTLRGLRLDRCFLKKKQGKKTS